MGLHYWRDRLSQHVITVTPGSPSDQVCDTDERWERVIPVPAPVDIADGNVEAARAQLARDTVDAVRTARQVMVAGTERREQIVSTPAFAKGAV